MVRENSDRSMLTTVNYSDPYGPLYIGLKSRPHEPTDSDLVVVTYNLKYAENIEEAIDALQTKTPLAGADIILLQEMDPDGVANIAQRLGLNYVYSPASITRDGNDFGNAILTPWLIRDPQKLILPGLHPLTGQQRIAIRSLIEVGGREVLVYSTHVEIATALPAFRSAQIQAILDDIPPDAHYVIVGGDFNTVSRPGVVRLATQTSNADLDHNTAGIGSTFTRFGLSIFAPDHIFSRGFDLIDGGVLKSVTASDHYPVWVRLISSD